MILEKPGLSKRQQQSRLFGFLIGLGVLLIAIAIMAVIPVRPYTYFHHQAAGVHFRYPETWKPIAIKDPTPGTLVVLAAPEENAMDVSPETVNVVIQPLHRGMTPTQFNQTAIRQFTGTFKKDVKVVTSEPDQLAGQPGYRFAYVIQAERPIKIMHIWTLVGSQAYIFTYTASEADFESRMPDVNMMLNSFKI